MPYKLRPAVPEDESFLFEMLYASLFVPDGEKPFDRKVLNEPWLMKYAEGWGRKGDLGCIAMDNNGVMLGAITSRYFDRANKGFGYVSDDVPELSMALLDGARGKGIGTALMKSLFGALKDEHIARVSLSVDPRNTPAMMLYERFGFQEVGIEGTSITMVAIVK
ncbi:GNAT family N-acetyltransferase [Paenibacillus sp. N1-5-1-14]|uniref:GNAT family N-acetyltransferase n=1 Tax=Paenibacillus radicibacter TaxID=2972488 RepID=UPI0021593BD7|nr:GNAT family N-acetyltransferase [Paenibacillus radicibacter]MCR8644422.1 GNAT family N-acetyltransferase [Paenibacillus radicibacter]